MLGSVSTVTALVMCVVTGLVVSNLTTSPCLCDRPTPCSPTPAAVRRAAAPEDLHRGHATVARGAIADVSSTSKGSSHGGVSGVNGGLPSWQHLMVSAHAKLRPTESVFGWWMHDTQLSDLYPESAAGFVSYRDFGNRLKEDKTLIHRYDIGYAQLFEPIRALGVPIRMLEIGLGCTYPSEGASVRTWGKYFPTMNLTMIEFHRACAKGFKKHGPFAPKGGWQYYLADGTKKTTARRVLKEANGQKFDIILEDASHLPQHQIDSFHAWWPLLKIGGVYVCEDLHTSFIGGKYGQTHRNGSKDGVSFFNYLSTHVHGHPNSEEKRASRPWGFHWLGGKYTLEPIGQVQCYWSMCFVHKATDGHLDIQDPWKYSGKD